MLKVLKVREVIFVTQAHNAKKIFIVYEDFSRTELAVQRTVREWAGGHWTDRHVLAGSSIQSISYDSAEQLIYINASTGKSKKMASFTYRCSHEKGFVHMRHIM